MCSSGACKKPCMRKRPARGCSNPALLLACRHGGREARCGAVCTKWGLAVGESAELEGLNALSCVLPGLTWWCSKKWKESVRVADGRSVGAWCRAEGEAMGVVLPSKSGPRDVSKHTSSGETANCIIS